MYQYSARLVRVVDADTVVLDIDLGFYQWRLGRSYRLARINAPELNTPEGKIAREALAGRLGVAKRFRVTTDKPDSFDRWIVELVADEANISDWLVASGHAALHVYR